MIPVSHALSGFLVYFALTSFGVVESFQFAVLVSVTVSLAPDLDGLWSSSLKYHH